MQNKNNLVESIIFKNNKNQCEHGIFKTAGEIISNRPYYTEDF